MRSGMIGVGGVECSSMMKVQGMMVVGIGE